MVNTLKIYLIMNIFSFPELKTKFSQIPQALNFCQPRGYKKKYLGNLTKFGFQFRKRK